MCEASDFVCKELHRFPLLLIPTLLVSTHLASASLFLVTLQKAFHFCLSFLCTFQTIYYCRLFG